MKAALLVICGFMCKTFLQLRICMPVENSQDLSSAKVANLGPSA